ncbi:MAG: glycoside hydrolase family 43 protein [Clostridia bacterium]|nr:glycoside hydrolase family 43 protein [Clostridia bacterium]
MLPTTFHNPILKGFYPDPSVCRVGDRYYMVTSSFYYFPGLPVFESRDLVHWRQIGNAIERPEQLDFRNCDISEGLWAATIRYHDGKFYIVNTLDVNGRTNRYNFIVTAEDPAGPWSEATIIQGADGIDPSLYFDEEGRVWFCSNHIPDQLAFPSHKQIILRELDPDTFQFTGPEYVVFDAVTDHSLFMEAPHIYRIDGWYYLITAEGGTQTNHCVNMYRSRHLTGSYEPCPHNPIVTNRGVKMVNGTGIAVTGHGDLVQTQLGEWYMVVLGIRPYEKRIEDYERFQPRMWIRTPDRNKSAQFNLGRETFLVPIAWEEDGWPVIDNENGLVNASERRPQLPWHREAYQSRVDNFEMEKLDLCWLMQRPPEKPFHSLTARPGFLRLRMLPGLAEEKATSAAILRRQQHNDFQVAAAMEFTPRAEGEEAGILVTQNERFSFLLVKERKAGRNCIACYQIINGQRHLLAAENAPEGRMYLFVEGQTGQYSFYYGAQEREMKALMLNADGSYLSTLVADGYVGVLLGMYASNGRVKEADRQADSHADFDWFRYEAIEE